VVKICARKRQNYISELHFAEVKGDARPWLVARWKAHGRLSTRVHWTFFLYLSRFRGYEAKCVQLGCFHRGSTSLQSNFTWRRSSPINYSWRQKLKIMGYLTAWDRISLCSLFMTQYRRTDGWTDGRICRSIYTALALCGALKKFYLYLKLSCLSTNSSCYLRYYSK